MIGAANILALAALLPAALNPSLLARDGAIFLSLCGGASAVSISIPMDAPLPGKDGTACCNKGCHSDEKRKRSKGVIDEAQ